MRVEACLTVNVSYTICFELFVIYPRMYVIAIIVFVYKHEYQYILEDSNV